MINTVFEYDHILMRAEYRTPDLHCHLAVHLILAHTNAICQYGSPHGERMRRKKLGAHQNPIDKTRPVWYDLSRVFWRRRKPAAL